MCFRQGFLLAVLLAVIVSSGSLGTDDFHIVKISHPGIALDRSLVSQLREHCEVLGTQDRSNTEFGCTQNRHSNAAKSVLDSHDDTRSGAINYRTVRVGAGNRRVKRSVQDRSADLDVPIINFDDKMTYPKWDEIERYLLSMSESYPRCFNLSSMGLSHENRKLYKVVVGDKDQPKENAVWMDAGIHAREWISPITALYALDKLTKACNDNSQESPLTQVDWIVMPMMNPDGYANTFKAGQRMWRKNMAPGNCKGVDLNRNFGIPAEGYGVGASSDTCTDTYKGVSKDSEPETQAFIKAMNLHFDRLKTSLSLHSYGQKILTPWGYKFELADDHCQITAWANRFAQAMRNVTNGRKYTVATASGGLYAAGGATDDYAHTIGVPFVATVELPDQGRYGHQLPASEISSVCKEFMGGLMEVARMANNSESLEEWTMDSNGSCIHHEKNGSNPV